MRGGPDGSIHVRYHLLAHFKLDAFCGRRVHDLLLELGLVMLLLAKHLVRTVYETLLLAVALRCLAELVVDLAAAS